MGHVVRLIVLDSCSQNDGQPESCNLKWYGNYLRMDWIFDGVRTIDDLPLLISL